MDEYWAVTVGGEGPGRGLGWLTAPCKATTNFVRTINDVRRCARVTWRACDGACMTCHACIHSSTHSSIHLPPNSPTQNPTSRHRSGISQAVASAETLPSSASASKQERRGPGGRGRGRPTTLLRVSRVAVKALHSLQVQNVDTSQTCGGGGVLVVVCCVVCNGAPVLTHHPFPPFHRPQTQRSGRARWRQRRPRRSSRTCWTCCGTCPPPRTPTPPVCAPLT